MSANGVSQPGPHGRDAHATETVAAVVLAAGLSSRMGNWFKPLLPIGPDEQPMIARVVEILRASRAVDPIIVVVGHQAEQVRSRLSDFGVCFIQNAGYKSGEMLSSAQAGARAAREAGADAFVLSLGDQPFVRPGTVRTLVNHWHLSRAPIVAPKCDGKRGHPIVMSAALIDELLALPPDATLKTLVQRYADRRLEVAVDDPGVLCDIDTPDDYAAARSRFTSVDRHTGAADETR